jgi:hypothetical protein
MKLVKKYRGKLSILIAASLALSILLTVRLVWATPPGLSIKVTAPNQLQLTVTNGVTNGIYSIYWREFLNSPPDWDWLTVGTTGQTNFLIDISETETGFFEAVATDDIDGDLVVNEQDARPFDPSIGIVTVTIETPANGANVQ